MLPETQKGWDLIHGQISVCVCVCVWVHLYVCVGTGVCVAVQISKGCYIFYMEPLCQEAIVCAMRWQNGRQADDGLLVADGKNK